MRLIDADALILDLMTVEMGTLQKWCYPCQKVLTTIDAQPSYRLIGTTWLNSYSPYTCEKCGYHVDSKTRYCPDCGRKAVNYESK